LLVPATQRVRARVIVREAAVLCGRDWFDGCLHALDPAARVAWAADEGARVTAGATLCEIEAKARALLSAERPALNFLQLLSATATLTREHVDAIAGASPNPRGCAILDTRKTLPGLRQAQKYAVRVGGGRNQRLALWHGILIKENHITAAGGIAQVLAAGARADAGVEIQIEVETLDQLAEALEQWREEHAAGQLRPAAHARRRGGGRRARRARGLRRRAAGSAARHRRHRRAPHLDRAR
jgi:nicotinate-nucleotide pyrophosphorylase (carboxylating)